MKTYELSTRNRTALRLPREASPEFRKIYFPAVFQKFHFVSEFSKMTKFKKVIKNQRTVRRFPAEMLDGGWPWKKKHDFWKLPVGRSATAKGSGL
jgi:hypothetical protein